MEEKIHNITLEDRKRLLITGVDEVKEFNEGEVTIFLNASKLMVKGCGLKVCEVSKENGGVVIEGESIDNISYSKRAGKRDEGVIRRLLK